MTPELRGPLLHRLMDLVNNGTAMKTLTITRQSTGHARPAGLFFKSIEKRLLFHVNLHSFVLYRYICLYMQKLAFRRH